MSAETLRRAAGLMRERAKDATEGPWTAQHIPASAVANQHIIERWFVMGCFDGNPRNPTGPSAICEYEGDADHVASWHPAVALAVADWLDSIASAADEVESLGLTFGGDVGNPALAVANAYLQETP